MNNTPLVSIIVPTYNRVHLLGDTLNSILAQSYTNWECIVVDDGSMDETLETFRYLQEQDTRFRFLKRPKTVMKGASACRNYGFEQSKGAYVQWFDSDDLMHPDKIRLKIDYALKHNADVIIDEHSENINDKIPTSFQVTSFISEDFYIDYLLGKKPVITNDVMLKRNIIGRHRFDVNIHHGEEFEFYSHVFKQKLTYCFLDVVLTRYRVSLDSVSRSGKHSESLIYLSKKMLRENKSNSLIVNRARRQGRKTYKNLIMENNLAMVFKHFNFFRTCHKKSSIVFLGYLFYNVVTKRGFDRMKPNF